MKKHFLTIVSCIFLPTILLAQNIQEVIKPKYIIIIAMHIPPKDIETESKSFLSMYPNGVVFKTPMKTKILTK